MGAGKPKTVFEALTEYDYAIIELSEHTQCGYKSRLKCFANRQHCDFSILQYVSIIE